MSAKTELQRKIKDCDLQIICRKFFQETSKPIYTEYLHNDIGSGQLFSDVYIDLLRYCPEAKQWYVYDGKRWREDKGGLDASAAAKILSAEWINYAYSIPDRRLQESYCKFVSKYGLLSCRKTMLEDAKSVYYIHAESFDSDIDLLNCLNGTLNLQTMEFNQHDPDDYITKLANVEYHAEATCPDFSKFLNEMTQGDKDKAEYMKRLCGYCLTGLTVEEEGYIFYGSTTRNGKGTFIDCITHLMGDYAVNVLPETLQEKIKDGSKASPDILRLKGARLAYINEPPKHFKLDVANFKNLTGGDRITARALYQEEQEFDAQFKIMFITNYLPYVNDDTLFISDRINVIECDRHFSRSERDKGLKRRLKLPENLSGVLNWCLQGLSEYHKDGLNPPNCVKEATKEYRRKSDKIQRFLDETIERKKGNSFEGSDLYDRYKLWCSKSSYYPDGKQYFYESLLAKGVMRKFGRVNGAAIRNVIVDWDYRFKVATQEDDNPFIGESDK